MAEILCLLYWLTAAPPQRKAGGQYLHVRAPDVKDQQNFHAINLLWVVHHSIWQDRFRHCLVHHFLAEKWRPI